MKKILALIVIGVIGYFGYGYYTNNNVTSTDNGDIGSHTFAGISYFSFTWDTLFSVNSIRLLLLYKYLFRYLSNYKKISS